MILVDTSVWIDFFRSGSGPLEDLIRDRNRVAICGVILQEILQGIRDSETYELTKKRLLFIPYLDADRDVYLLGASLYRLLRKEGVTVPSADALIAAVAIRHGYPVLTHDIHFATIAANSDLRLFDEAI